MRQNLFSISYYELEIIGISKVDLIKIEPITFILDSDNRVFKHRRSKEIEIFTFHEKHFLFHIDSEIIENSKNDQIKLEP